MPISMDKLRNALIYSLLHLLLLILLLHLLICVLIYSRPILIINIFWCLIFIISSIHYNYHYHLYSVLTVAIIETTYISKFTSTKCLVIFMDCVCIHVTSTDIALYYIYELYILSICSVQQKVKQHAP